MATKKSARKTSAKKTSTRGRKAVAETSAVAATPTTGRGRGRKKNTDVVFGYMTEKTVASTEEGGESKTEYGAFNGPFFSANDALEDAAMVAGDDVSVK